MWSHCYYNRRWQKADIFLIVVLSCLAVLVNQESSAITAQINWPFYKRGPNEHTTLQSSGNLPKNNPLLRGVLLLYRIHIHRLYTAQTCQFFFAASSSSCSLSHFGLYSMSIESIFAAKIRSVSPSPPIECVVSTTFTPDQGDESS